MRSMRILIALLLFLLLPLPGTDTVETAGPAATPPASAGKVAYIPIATDINPLTARFLKRTLDDAKQAGATTIVVHITSPGGRVDTTMEMTSALLAMPKDGPQLVAFIDEHAISAAALIAYCHPRIYMTPRATIGDIGVIFQTSEGKIEYAPEKMETVVRGMLRNAAQNRGWSEAKLVKMTARNQELWRVETDTGVEWIIGDDLPGFLTKHPELDRKDDHLVTKEGKRVGAVKFGKDRLLYYTAKEAVDERMATGLVDDLDALYRQLGTSKAQVVDLSPTATESVSWVLAAWAPLLAGLAVLFIILEFKMPGGLFISLAAIAGLAFFICQFYQELASYAEVIAVLAGLAVVVLDIFVLPTGGWLSAMGLLLLAAGLVLSFMPDVSQFQPGSEGWGRQFLNAFVNSILALAVMAAGVAMAIAAAPRLKAVRRISIEAAIGGTADAGSVAATTGAKGVARTGLSPSGFVTIDGREISATSQHGVFIPPGTAIEVVEMRFGEAVVRPVEGA